MKKFTILLTIVLMVAFTLAGCGSSSNNASGSDNGSSSQSADTSKGDASMAKKVTITMGFWGTAEDLKVYQEASKSIKDVYPNITLKIKQYPSSDQFWQQLPGEIAAGVAPDFIKVSNEGAYEYISKHLFVPLDDYIQQDKLDMNVYSPAVSKVWQVDGKTYGIPNTLNTGMFFINKKMWDAANMGAYPKTWDEVFQDAKKLTTDKVHGICINIDAFHITNYAKSYGGGWDHGKTINSPQNVQALQEILKMYDAGVAVTPKTLGYGWDGEVFANNKAAMTTGGYWYKGYLKDANPDLEYVALPIPKGTTQGSTMISDAFTVLKGSKYKAQAVQAAYYLTSKPIQSQFIKLGYNPSLKSLSDDYYKLNPIFKPTQSALATATDFGYPTDTKRFIDTLVKQLENTVLGGKKKSAKEILDSIQSQFK